MKSNSLYNEQYYVKQNPQPPVETNVPSPFLLFWSQTRSTHMEYKEEWGCRLFTDALYLLLLRGKAADENWSVDMRRVNSFCLFSTV